MRRLEKEASRKKGINDTLWSIPLGDGHIKVDFLDEYSVQ